MLAHIYAFMHMGVCVLTSVGSCCYSHRRQIEINKQCQQERQPSKQTTYTKRLTVAELEAQGRRMGPLTSERGH